MQSQILLLSLFAPVLVSSWSLTWYAQANCTEPLGHIDSETSTLTKGTLDSSVQSLIMDGQYLYLPQDDDAIIGEPLPSGECVSLTPGSTNDWEYSEYY